MRTSERHPRAFLSCRIVLSISLLNKNHIVEFTANSFPLLSFHFRSFPFLFFPFLSFPLLSFPFFGVQQQVFRWIVNLEEEKLNVVEFWPVSEAIVEHLENLPPVYS